MNRMTDQSLTWLADLRRSLVRNRLTDRAMPGGSIVTLIIISIWAACTLVLAQATRPTGTRADSSQLVS
jgi:hypothetical protein